MLRFTRLILAAPLLLLVSCDTPREEKPAEPWSPRELAWEDRGQWVRDTALVQVTGYVRLPLEMTTAEDRSSLELWPRRNQTIGTDLHMSIEIGEQPNQQRPLPEQYANSSLFIHGKGGEVIRHQSRVSVIGRWLPGQRELLEVISIELAEEQLQEPAQVYDLPLSKEAMRNGEAEGRLVHAFGKLRQPSIILPDRDIDLVLAAKGFNVTVRVLMGEGPSQMRPGKGLLSKGKLLDMQGREIDSETVAVYGVFHDGKIYVEELKGSPSDPLRDHTSKAPAGLK